MVQHAFKRAKGLKFCMRINIGKYETAFLEVRRFKSMKVLKDTTWSNIDIERLISSNFEILHRIHF